MLEGTLVDVVVSREAVFPQFCNDPGGNPVIMAVQALALCLRKDREVSRRELVRLFVDVKGSELGHGQRLKSQAAMVCDAATIGKYFDL